MYNRYIPQPDGSYRRNRISEPVPRDQSEQTAPPPPRQPEVSVPPSQPSPPPCRQSVGAGDFLRSLLPMELDTGDLLIILLLLLMAGDRQEEQSTALLTLALYLFL